MKMYAMELSKACLFCRLDVESTTLKVVSVLPWFGFVFNDGEAA